MAIGTNLPPQAYTRETLTQAFAWLQSQPESIRRIVTTPESLVGLYTRNQRFGPDSRTISTAPISPLAGDGISDDDFEEPTLTEAPISAQNFKTDLKTLAEGLKQFEDQKSSRAQTHQATQPLYQAQQHVPQPASQNIAHATTQQVPHSVSQQLRAPSAAISLGTSGVQGLTPGALAMVQEIKNSFNLSSDLEAINMMVSIAYKNLKTLLA